jgi:terminase small subunit-like protein
MARKSGYTLKIAQDICDRIASGKSLVRVCKAMKLTYSTVMRWLEQHEEFREMYAQAREYQADYLADEVIDIADNNKLSPESRRVRVDARKWKAAKLRPKKYGDRSVHQLEGGDSPIKTESTVITAALHGELQTKSLDELPRLFTETVEG